jgi:hypothetical protein
MLDLAHLLSSSTRQALPAKDKKRKFTSQLSSSDEEYIPPPPVKTTRDYVAKDQNVKAHSESTTASQSSVEVGKRVGKINKGKAALQPAKVEDKKKQEVPLSQQFFKPLYEIRPHDIVLHEHQLETDSQWGPHDLKTWTLNDVLEHPAEFNPPSPWQRQG